MFFNVLGHFQDNRKKIIILITVGVLIVFFIKAINNYTAKQRFNSSSNNTTAISKSVGVSNDIKIKNTTLKDGITSNNNIEVDEKSIDKKLENEMDLAYSLVKLGRSARNSANIKNRQPLSKMLISVDTLPEYYGNIVKEELNVKEVDLGANMNEYVHFEIKPNLPVLGKEYGKLIPKIREEISKLNQMDLANKVKNGGVEYIDIDGTQIELTSENLLVTMQGKEGFAFAGEGEIGVVLDTTITPELKEEGYVREILSKVQNMRKDKGFEVLDKINLYVSENEMLEELVKKFESEIKKETLTENIVFNTQRNTYTEVSINGEKLMLDVEVVK